MARQQKFHLNEDDHSPNAHATRICRKQIFSLMGVLQWRILSMVTSHLKDTTERIMNSVKARKTEKNQTDCISQQPTQKIFLRTRKVSIIFDSTVMVYGEEEVE